MQYRDNLIIDVGMHTGQDTAYYLSKGFDVVAIEANPELARQGRSKFNGAIASGRLQILEVGIAQLSGEAEFYISKRKSVWSSFDKANATKEGGGCTPVRVNCVQFVDVLREHGVPHYLKVDIEGNDRLCLQALESTCLPRFVSVEMSHDGGDDDINLLSDLGYTRFKCVRQNDLSVIAPGQLRAYLESRRRASEQGLFGRALRAARNLQARLNRPREGGWVFPRGASGPFGDDLSGTWHDAGSAVEIRQSIHRADKMLTGAGLGDWFDIHAAISE